MLVSILANLVQQGGVIPPPVVQHNVPDAYIEDKGGSDGKKLSETGGINKLIQRNDEEFLIMIAKFITEQSNNLN